MVYEMVKRRLDRETYDSKDDDAGNDGGDGDGD